MQPAKTLRPLTKNHFFEFFNLLNEKGGPDKTEYGLLNEVINSIPFMLTKNIISHDDIGFIKAKCEFLKTDISIMGHIKLKPYGYAGDYHIIERIYQDEVSKKYMNWDKYSLDNSAANAVRNRKGFFKNMIHEKLQQHNTINLLNIASGPARDLKEIYEEIDPTRLRTTCIEIDHRAIEYAKRTCTNYLNRIDFINQNVFRFHSEEKFDLIWSAGLFDYFNDSSFIQLLQQFEKNLKDNGEMIIGNFSKNNPSRIYMEIFGEWFLNHRSADELTDLAIKAGVEQSRIQVDQELLGVNLFLRIKK